MPKFYGSIGFVRSVKDDRGIVRQVVEERNYFGEITRYSRRLETSSEQVNDNIELQNDISIIADGYATDHIEAMKYVRISGARWKIRSVELRYPKLILSIGGLYNGGPAIRAPEDTGM